MPSLASSINNNDEEVVPNNPPKGSSDAHGVRVKSNPPMEHPPPPPKRQPIVPITVATKTDKESEVPIDPANFSKVSMNEMERVFMDCCEEPGYILESDVQEYLHLAMMSLRFNGKVLHPDLSAFFAQEIYRIISKNEDFQSSLVAWGELKIILTAVVINMDTQDKNKFFTVPAIPDEGYTGKKNEGASISGV